MNRRQFLTPIIYAPAIITSAGLFRGPVDVWVPDDRYSQYRKALKKLGMLRAYELAEAQARLDRHYLAMVLKFDGLS